jgi:hypothetical protein
MFDGKYFIEERRYILGVNQLGGVISIISTLRNRFKLLASVAVG